MAFPISNSAETGLSTGTTVTTTNSDDGTAGTAFTAVTIGASSSITFSTAQAHTGTLCYAFTSGGSYVNQHVDWGSAVTTAGASWSGRMYCYYTAVPVALAHDIIRLNTGGTGLQGGFGFGGGASGGQIQIHGSTGGSTAVGTISTNQIPVNAWFRVEWTFTVSTTAASANAWMWTGANVESAADPGAGNKASWTGGTTSQNTIDTAFIGGTFGNVSETSYLDDLIVVSGTTMPGPLATVTLQDVLPDADIATTGWTTAPLFSKVNDASDATVITSTLA